MPIEKPASCKHPDPCWKCRGFTGVVARCPLKSDYKRWKASHVGTERIDYDVIPETGRSSEVRVVSATKEQERETKRPASATLGPQPETKRVMPDIPHPECFLLDCEEPRKPKDNGDGYIAACDKHARNRSTRNRAQFLWRRWSADQERGGGGPSAR